jgi:hypothetical protein
LRTGDAVRLRREPRSAPANAEGVVVGFLRRQPELVVVRLAGSRRIVEVRPEDVEKSDGAPP